MKYNVGSIIKFRRLWPFRLERAVNNPTKQEDWIRFTIVPDGNNSVDTKEMLSGKIVALIKTDSGGIFYHVTILPNKGTGLVHPADVITNISPTETALDLLETLDKL